MTTHAEAQALRDRRLAAVLADLDRCEHGRHEGDVCSGCGGPSKGNPIMGGVGVDRQIGYDISGNPICVPDGRRTYEPDAWKAQRS